MQTAMDFIPIIEITFSLLFGSLCSFAGSKKLSYIIVMFSLLLNIVCSLTLVLNIGAENIFYSVGGWSAPYGIELRIDKLSAAMSLVINILGFISVLGHTGIMHKEISQAKIPLAFSFLLFCTAGLLGIVFSNDLFNIYVFIEISSISCYILSTLHKSGRSLVASFHYLIIGSIGATFYLIGIGFIFAATGSLNISNIYEILLQGTPDVTLIKIGTVFSITGLLMKIGFFPFHQWMINAYSRVPSFISVFFSGTISKVMIYVVARITFFLFPTNPFGNDSLLIKILPWLVSCGIIIPALLALKEKNPKKLLAYSSVSQMGYIISGLFGSQEIAINVVCIGIIAHSIAKSLLFAIVGSDTYQPWHIFVLLVCCASLIGIPITAGFFAKILILNATLSSSVVLTVSVLMGSVISIFYCRKLLLVLHERKSAFAGMPTNEQPAVIKYSLIAFTIMLLALGFAT